MEFNEMKIINVGVDIETLSTMPTAAMIAIAAKTFDMDDDTDPGQLFRKNINVTYAALNGYHIEPETLEWWTANPPEAKERIINGTNTAVDVRQALMDFTEFLRGVKADAGADEVHLWMQGTDFDGSILRYSYRKEFPNLGRDAVPWGHTALRDSRTFIIEGVRILFGETKDPYSFIPKPEVPFTNHDPMGDIDQMIWNVRFINKSIKSRMK